jgi:OOP family OmpA-OmpF porin
MKKTAKQASPRRAALLVAAFALATGALGARAADKDGTRLLTGKAVTEAGLVEALTPKPKNVAKRSLRLGREGAGATEHKPSASLLITFETNSAELTSPAKQQLDVVAAALNNERLSSYTFNVEGHADPTGRSDSNQTLSQRRAESVRGYLVGVRGVSEQRLKAEGHGDRELLNRNHPTAPENRRVTIVTVAP